MLVLTLLLIGLAIALDPLPLTGFMVVLPSEHGTRKGAAFVFGWLVSLAIVVTITVLATGDNPPKSNTVPTLAKMSPWFAMALAPALQPWGLIAAGAATVVGAKLASWQDFLALFGFCVLASSTYVGMEIYAAVRPEQSQAFLGSFRKWIARTPTR